MKITVVGLGCEHDAVSMAGFRAISSAERVIYKTKKTPLFEGAEAIDAIDCDDLYVTAANDDALNASIAARVADYAQTCTVAYCVPGDAVTDSSLDAIFACCEDIAVIPAAGRAEAALKYKPALAYAVYAARAVADAKTFDTDLPLVIYELSDALLAGDVKLRLTKFWSEETPVLMPDGIASLDELDRLPRYGADVFAVLLPLALTEKSKFTYADLLSVMAILTGEEGCPWDKEQTHESIRGNLVEEAYEAVEAIDNRDVENMVEEMGDILLQAVFHGVIGERADEFDCGDILDNLCGKLLFRHPHVFGAVRAKDASGALQSWEAAKAVEKSQDTLVSALNSIPKSFPQTLRAVKVAKRAAKAKIGLDADAELYRDIIADKLASLDEAEDKERAIGECVYALANIARLHHIDPEIAAAKVIDGYVARCKKIEDKLNKKGVSIYDADAAQVQRALVEVMYDEACGR